MGDELLPVALLQEAISVRITPLELVNEYNDYTKPKSIADTWDAPDMVDGFLLSLAVNTFTMCTVFILFFILRSTVRQLYSARLLAQKRYDEYDGKFYTNLNRGWQEEYYHRGRVPPKQTVKNCCQWFWFIVHHSEEQIFCDLGLDFLVMVKFLVLGLQILSCILVMNVPLYVYFVYSDHVRFEWDHSMADLEAGSNVLWVYFVFVWMKTGICLFFLWRHTSSYVKFRQRYLAQTVETSGSDTGICRRMTWAHLQHKTAIFVQKIPRGQRTEKELRELFNSTDIWKNKVISVYVKRKLLDKSAYDERVASYQVKQKKGSIQSQADPTGSADTGGPKKLNRRKSWFGTTPSNHLQELRSWHDLPDSYRTKTYSEPVGDAFIIFKTPFEASLAANAQLTMGGTFETSLAPSPHNVYEPNIGYQGVAGCDYRSCCAVSVYMIVLLFWAVPVTLIASMTSLDSLEAHWSWVTALREYPTLFDFVQNYAPTLSLHLFMALLPTFLSYMAKAEGIKTKSSLDATLTQRYFLFLLLNVLLVASLSGGVFAVAYDISSDLHSLPKLLGKSLPNMYLFFVSYVMLQAMTIVPLDLLEYYNLFLRLWETCFGNENQSELNAARHFVHSGAARLAQHLLVFAISLVYSSFTPLMLPFSLLYFALALLVTRQQGYYAHARPYESGGEMWLIISHCVLAGLGIYILAIMGMILLLEGVMQAFLLTPLIFVVIVVAYKMRVKYYTLSQYLVLKKPKCPFRRRRGCCCCEDRSKEREDRSKERDKAFRSSRAGPCAAPSPQAGQKASLIPSGGVEPEMAAFYLYAAEFGGGGVIDDIDSHGMKSA